MKELDACDFSGHETGSLRCKACESGYPQQCYCGGGGLIHAEIVKVQDDGYVQLTHCDKCGLPA